MAERIDSFLRRIGGALCALAACSALAACGTAVGVALVPPYSQAERLWIGNVRSLISTLNSDIDLSTVGGANLATAERTFHNASAIYSLLVAYDLFGDCGHALANAGASSARAAAVEQTLITACGRLESAARLFQHAMTTRRPRPLLAAGRLVLSVVPLLTTAEAQLSLLRPRVPGVVAPR